MSTTNTTTTLWQATHDALRKGELNAARRLLEQLARCSDVTDYLGNLEVYLPGRRSTAFDALIQDRIDAVNSRVETNRFNKYVVLAAL